MQFPRDSPPLVFLRRDQLSGKPLEFVLRLQHLLKAKQGLTFQREDSPKREARQKNTGSQSKYQEPAKPLPKRSKEIPDFLAVDIEQLLAQFVNAVCQIDCQHSAGQHFLFDESAPQRFSLRGRPVERRVDCFKICLKFFSELIEDRALIRPDKVLVIHRFRFDLPLHLQKCRLVLSRHFIVIGQQIIRHLRPRLSAGR